MVVMLANAAEQLAINLEADTPEHLSSTFGVSSNNVRTRSVSAGLYAISQAS
jgi:hypothetical protein